LGGGVQQLSILADVARRLEHGGIAYALTGSVAMSCYVPERTTVDVDIVVQLGRDEAAQIVAMFESGYYIDRGAVDEAIRLARSFNIIHCEGLLKVDFIIPRPSALLQQRFERRRRLVVGDTQVWVLSPEDLILAKLEWMRGSRSERQFADVRGLLTQVPDLDDAYLSDSARRLGVVDLLNEAKS
jgi:hypothetical protein